LNYTTLIFDLDGTISDPATGFVRSINYALRAHGYEEKDEKTLHAHIGPPLDHSLAELCDTEDRAHIASLVSSYRERYSDVGCTEVEVYPGMPEVLSRLAGDDAVKLAVCSSKRVDFVERTLEHFDLHKYFELISGGEIGTEKPQQLGELLSRGAVAPDSLMIGDRYFDLVAARHNSLSSCGVLWGYGSREELEGHTPDHLLTSPKEILNLV
jgi:phosphoglycolate phosphatase